MNLKKHKRNCRICIDVMIHGMTTESAEYKYGISHTTIRTIVKKICSKLFGLNEKDNIKVMRKAVSIALEGR